MNINDMARQAFLNSLTENLSDFDKLMLQIDEICDMAEDLSLRAKQLADEAEEQLRRARGE
jgi:hypothetical protein